jgi:hypothetical protein
MDLLEKATLGGERHTPEPIDDLVDTYEVEAQGFLHKRLSQKDPERYNSLQMQR